MPTCVRDDIQAVDELLGRVNQLHTAPQVAQRILHLTRDLDFRLSDVVTCLENDPALAAKILRLVNSAHYGLAAQVDNLQQAVAHIGQRSLRLATITFSLVAALTRGGVGRFYQDYWQHALTMAVAAARLSETSPALERDTAYAAGLFADLGVLVLAQLEGERYTSLFRQTSHGPGLVEAERHRFGFGHPAVGARLLERWEFPPALVAAIRYHHDEERETPLLDVAVRAAHWTSEVLWNPASPHLAAVRQLLQDEFRIDIDGFISLALGCKEDLAAMAQLFDIHLVGSIDCQALLEEAARQHSDAALEAALQLDSLMAVYADHRVPATPAVLTDPQPPEAALTDDLPQPASSRLQ